MDRDTNLERLAVGDGGMTLTPATRLRAGAGTYRQFADLEQIYGVRGGGTSLSPERARHIDVSVIGRCPCGRTCSCHGLRVTSVMCCGREARSRVRDADGGIVPDVATPGGPMR